ncbi:hypothetical protein SAMN02745126_05936 [Enhydrobacter aerosaccus]|uniref:O-antigen ligase like membrane protein n=1 Tax=Enhydrobacter aerosaccus TaxID=225324 RepID=A0A1T4TBW6_9HYPH|nr:hypothetical protein [Enhydrobacter aerosaccus]SKA37658.1 hypothetical protein SAMN02745126_05936 [Enhydrobacter aerosaccus]
MSYAPYHWHVESVWAGRTPNAAAMARAPGISAADMALICLFLLGLYTNYTIWLSTKVPFPSAPAGIAGVILLWRRRDAITPRAFGTLIGVMFLYVVSILCAPNLTFLSRRLNGLIQLTYSIVIGYALFLTVIQARRSQITGLFLGISLFIVVGCLLETYGGLRPISDSVRQVIYNRGVYENDLRDMLLYHRVRPKFFASEPASVTFCYTLFTFVWFVVSRWRFKLLLYVVLVAVGIFAMPGPTLLLLLALILPYMLFLASRQNGRLNVAKLLKVAIVSVFFLAAFFVLAQTVFSERFKQAQSGNDPSFFYRVRGPAIAAKEIVRDFPLQGAGLTGEPFIEQRVVNIYVQSPAYSVGWQVVSPATELLINYFWLHWIYLGAGFGVLIGAALTRWFFVIGIPSAAFCWMTWAILGQASGAYVGPTCWAVLFLSGAAAVLHERAPDPAEDRRRYSTSSQDLIARVQNIQHGPQLEQAR